MKQSIRLFCYCLLFVLTFTTSANAQHLRQQKMEQLQFMIGDWVGISTTYQDGEIKQRLPAFQKIQYAVDQHIITIDLHSESLQLHTVIYYDEEEDTYFYHPFYKNGVGQFPATYEDGKLIVARNETTRFIFTKTAEGGFQEYGERLENGRWVKYFEDNFKNIQ